MKSVPADTFKRMIEMRRDLHKYPELSWKERRTADKICQRLDELDISYERGIAKTGIVAEIPGPQDVPYVALRADMDALPIQEETGLEFASVHDGVMHACGHDGHTSMLLGAAELILEEPHLQAPIRLIFQPAEEKGEGAQAMIKEGVLDKVGMIFGGHIDRHFDPGVIAVTPGAVNASTDQFYIDIGGKGGHAARPHESVDAVVVGSLIVMSLQTIVSREINPAHPSVISVSVFQAGTAPNVLAGRARLEGTIRAQEHKIRLHLQERITHIAQSVGELHKAKVEVEIEQGTPPVINPPDMTELSIQAAEKVVGEEKVAAMEMANMGGEDFGYYLEKVPGSFVRLGAKLKGREGFPAHSSRFNWDEEVLAVGASYYATIARLAGEKLALAFQREI